MFDRERIVKGFECCRYSLKSHCDECPYIYEGLCSINDCTADLASEAFAMLKEQKEERKAEQSDWISVKERMPVELHSIFYPLYGKKQWSNAMWREQSDKVLVTIAFKDGTRIVSTGETHDGVWRTAISRTLDPIVTHWMQFPELPMEENE